MYNMMNESHRCYAEQEFTVHFCAIQSRTVQNESMGMGIRTWSGVGKVPGEDADDETFYILFGVVVPRV